MTAQTKLAAGTGSGVVVEFCQVCGNPDLQSILFLGYHPPPNQMRLCSERPREQTAYPVEWLYCVRCQLVQLGMIVDPHIVFPPEFPYTSGTTKVLRENFAELYKDCRAIISLAREDLIIDIGSNDGTLLSNFKNGGHRVLGIEPTQVGGLAIERGIPTAIEFFNRKSAEKIGAQHGLARIITATNVFAHVENIHDVLDGILLLLDERGIFVSESHYLIDLIEALQYDTVYHEHLRYYSLHSIKYLLNTHGLEVIHAKRIPTHGGSFRVYAARAGSHPVKRSVGEMLNEEIAVGLNMNRLREFKDRVVLSKLQLLALLFDIKKRGHRIYGIGSPARACTLVNYVGLDDGILDCALEVEGSLKIGKYMPGTRIPVREESALCDEQPEYALLLSWHVAQDIMPKLTARGFKGKYIVPLPTPRVVEYP